jgi:hypothetical protein
VNKNNKTPLNEEEFEDWFQNTDLGVLIPTEGGIVVPGLLERKAGRPKIGRKITLTLPEETIEDLRELAEQKGVGYQTYARMILMAHLKKPA